MNTNVSQFHSETNHPVNHEFQQETTQDDSDPSSDNLPPMSFQDNLQNSLNQNLNDNSITTNVVSNSNSENSDNSDLHYSNLTNISLDSKNSKDINDFQTSVNSVPVLIVESILPEENDTTNPSLKEDVLGVDTYLDTYLAPTSSNFHGLQVNTSKNGYKNNLSVPPSPSDSYSNDHNKTDDGFLSHSFNESGDRTITSSDSDDDITLKTQPDLISLNISNLEPHKIFLKNIYLNDLALFDKKYLKSGLSSDVASQRLHKDGQNVLGGKRKFIPLWVVLLWRQSVSVMNFVLLFAAILSAVVSDFVDMGVILVIIVVNIAIGFLQEFKSESTMAKLKELTSPMSKVIRDNTKLVVPSSSLVVGDIVLLKEGDRVPADLRISECINLSCHEALLTGESVPIEKTTESLLIINSKNKAESSTITPVHENVLSFEQSNIVFDKSNDNSFETNKSTINQVEVEIEIKTPSLSRSQSSDSSHSSSSSDKIGTIPLGDRINMAYMSTTVTSGKGRGIVVATGTRTEIGKIAKSMGERRNQTTPLQRKLNLMGFVLMMAAVISLIIVVISVGLHKGFNNIFPNALIIGVTVAVAIIPESLVAVVTLTMSVGVRKMVKQNAIVRKLAALETLGSIQHICSDKTGTLTEGKMVVNTIWTPTNNYSVETNILQEEINGKVVDTNSNTEINSENMPENLKQLLFVGALCNSSSITLVEEAPSAKKPGKFQKIFGRFYRKLSFIFPEKQKKTVSLKKGLALVGEPTELALTALSQVTKFTKDSEIVSCTYSGLLYEFPFNSTIKRMSVLYKYSSEIAHVLTKGASEGVLDLCSKYLIIEEGEQIISSMNDSMKSTITLSIETIAKRGLRVLCLAYRPIPIREAEAPQLVRENFENDLIFIGLVGIQDPPRPEVAYSMKVCEEAGIVVHMLTGDHYLTAKAISEQIGILKNIEHPSENDVMEAKKFDLLTPQDLKNMHDLPFVIARCSPQSKVKMIEALHARKKLVAMTGDGVNDAPSIKLADIGIAMGKGGSDVTKEAADIILTDDKFSTIVSAIKEGRRIFANIRKFVVHLLSANVAQLFVLLIPVMAGFDVPLNPTQILWLNMVTGTPPALSLGIERASKKVMKRARRNSLFNLETISDLMFYGISMAVVTLLCYFLLGVLWLKRELKSSQTVSFTVLTMMLMFHSYNCRHKRKRFWQDGAWKSKWLHASVIISIVLQVFILYIPGVNNIVFHQKGLDWVEWLFVIIGTICFMTSAEIWKLTKSTLSTSKNEFILYLKKKFAIQKLKKLDSPLTAQDVETKPSESKISAITVVIE